MKRTITAVFLIPIIVVGSFLTYSFTTNYFEISKNLDIFTTLFKELNTYYVDDVEPSKLMREGIDAMLSSLDPYTNYISEADMEGYRLQTTGKYGGIGAVIRKSGEYVIVSEPYEGYAAEKAGLKAGDKILEVDGKQTKDKNTDEVSKILKGQPGTEVLVKIKRLAADGSEKDMDVSVIREEIKIKNVPYYGMINETIGFIRLSHFTEKAGKEVQDALKTLKENPTLKGVVLDLRGNPGGLLNEAVNVSNTFIDKGQEIVSTKGKINEWDKTFKTLNSAIDASIPIAVLTNGGSASASEIVSGSIQDLDRGVIIGQKTFGKGLVQTTRSLSYNTKLKVTTAKYYIPSGRCIQAINYNDKDEEGKAPKLPDSLKVAFKTQSGRVVYDGGGIDPDVEIERERLSKIGASLLGKGLIFDFATIYASKNPKMNDPRNFELSEKDYEDFTAFLSDKEYDYVTQSENVLKDLEKTAQKEKYFEAIKEEFKELQNKMIHDKNKDLFKEKKEILDLLEEEIISRYYYESGRIEASFDNDPEVLKAVEVLNNKQEYMTLLKTK